MNTFFLVSKFFVGRLEQSTIMFDKGRWQTIVDYQQTIIYRQPTIIYIPAGLAELESADSTLELAVSSSDSPNLHVGKHLLLQ